MIKMSTGEHEHSKRALEEYWKDPIGVLHSRDNAYKSNYGIEWAICQALAQGGWAVYPGDGCGIVANMIRAAEQAAVERERKRCAGIARAVAADYGRDNVGDRMCSDAATDVATAIETPEDNRREEQCNGNG